MAQDGSQKWDGGSGAFSHLLHHPRNSSHVDTYGRPREAQRDVTPQANAGNTGTWNGPAPAGNLNAERRASSASASTSIPDSIMLPGGKKLPLLGFGTYKVKEAQVIRDALELGYRHFDFATKYENEEIMGEGLKEFLEADPQNRSKLFLTSKVWNDAHRPELVRKSCEKTLSDLGCDYLDLLLVHWPEAFKPGTEEIDDVPIKDTWQALEQLVDDGKTKYIGVSNFSLTQLENLLEFARIKPVVNQIELHPQLAQRKLVGVALRKGIYSMAFSPIGHGDLSLTKLPEVVKVAEETGRSPIQVILKWNIQRGVVVIPRSTQKKNQEANIKDMFAWELTPDQKSVLDTLDAGERKVSPSWHNWDDPALGGATKPSSYY